MHPLRELPLFPLHSVLCPGIALPLHIFEPRYRRMIGECLETGSPFGVVLIRDGREVGPLAGHIADVGTTAVIRQAGRYPDGRLDIVTVGERRFRIESVDSTSAAHLIGTVEWLDEPLGGAPEAAEALAADVGRMFLAYLEQLQPAEAGSGTGASTGGTRPRTAGEEATAEPATTAELLGPEDAEEGAPGMDGADPPTDDASRREQLLSSARRLIANGDATAVSYLLTGLVQLDLAARQELLEIPDTMSRLRRLRANLEREQHLLGRNLRPMGLDLEVLALRRN
ncbi:MAG: LON peptidase substrate-binding domain-containing protein [Chloroflexota bacterium]